MGALREQLARGEQLVDLEMGRRMPEHRQAEGRLGDEEIAGHDLERRAGRIGLALVVAGDDDGALRKSETDLCRAEHVTGGVEADLGVAERHTFAWPDRLRAAAEVVAVTHRHDTERVRGGQYGAVTGAGMVGMPVRDERAGHRPRRVDKEIARRTIKSLGRENQQAT